MFRSRYRSRSRLRRLTARTAASSRQRTAHCGSRSSGCQPILADGRSSPVPYAEEPALPLFRQNVVRQRRVIACSAQPRSAVADGQLAGAWSGGMNCSAADDTRKIFPKLSSVQRAVRPNDRDDSWRTSSGRLPRSKAGLENNSVRHQPAIIGRHSVQTAGSNCASIDAEPDESRRLSRMISPAASQPRSLSAGAQRAVRIISGRRRVDIGYRRHMSVRQHIQDAAQRLQEPEEDERSEAGRSAAKELPGMHRKRKDRQDSGSSEPLRQFQ